jgi:DNA-directed RNA polymerase specialized sigma subunit
MTYTDYNADAEKLQTLGDEALLKELRDRETVRELAVRAAEEAAQRRNSVVLELASRNVSNVNIAQALGISRTRVSQLIARGLAVTEDAA